MRDDWYGDKRDLVKWGVLFHLARHYRVRAIIQVPFLRARITEGPWLESNRRRWLIAAEVWLHFRNLLDIRRLGRRCRLAIDVLDTRFDPLTRKSYIGEVVRQLGTYEMQKIVLLDPDTGLEPRRRTGSHVGLDEVAAVWRTLASGDWLVLYQHARRVKGWRGGARETFARACRVEVARVRSFWSTSASDVVLFALLKR